MERFRISEDKVVPTKFYFENFDHGKDVENAPDMYPVVEKTIIEFPSFYEWLPLFTLYNWKQSNGFATMNTNVSKGAVEDRTYRIIGGMNVSPSIGTLDKDLMRNIPDFEERITREDFSYKELKPNEISLGEKLKKQDFRVLSQMRIGSEHIFSLLKSDINPKYFICGYHVFIEGPRRAFPAGEVKIDALDIATITQCAHQSFGKDFLNSEMPKDDPSKDLRDYSV